jgi:hypothetical protein
VLSGKAGLKEPKPGPKAGAARALRLYKAARGASMAPAPMALMKLRREVVIDKSPVDFAENMHGAEKTVLLDRRQCIDA